MWSWPRAVHSPVESLWQIGPRAGVEADIKPPREPRAVSTAPNGAVSTATYDKADQVTKSTMPKDTETGPERISQYEYDTVGNLATVTEPKGAATTGDATDFVTRYAYEAIYQQTSVTNAAGDVISYTYDEVGNLVKTVDPRKNASADPDDFTSTTEYDLNHRPVSTTDAAGNTGSTDYDALNRPVKQFQPYDPADGRYNDANVFTETTYDLTCAN
jgi:YD repeat-containing protein